MSGRSGAIRMTRVVFVAVLLAGGLLVNGRTSDAPSASATGPVMFHCQLNATCPEVTVAGDPLATLGAGAAPFRGYGDPSLEYDASTGTLWLEYSWLDVLVTAPGPPPQLNFGVRTHLAQSTDGGASFAFVKALNATMMLAHPDSSVQGWAFHEVPTLVKEASGGWQSLWLTYFEPLGEPPGSEDRSDFYYTRSLGSSPSDLGNSSQAWIRGGGTSPSFGAVHNLSALPQLSDCDVFTEPSLFSHGGSTYLATNCAVFDGSVRRDDLERLVLLRQEVSGYSYVGALLSYADALDLSATRIEQTELAFSQSGVVILVGTPILTGGSPEHLGCVVFQVSHLPAAQVLRDGAGDAVQLARITGDDTSSIGPGACSYDRDSQTGVMMVSHTFTASPFDLGFSLRATGIHPAPFDWDGDGSEDVVDGDDDNDGYSDVAESGSPLCDGVNSDAFEDAVIDDGCPGGPAAAGAHSEAQFNTGTNSLGRCGVGGSGTPSAYWPADLSAAAGFSQDRINVSDLASFVGPIRRLGTKPGDADFSGRHDLVPGTTFGEAWITITDLANVSMLAPPMPPFSGTRAFGGPACTDP